MQKTIREQEEKLNSQAQTFKEKEEMMKREENEKLELLKQDLCCTSGAENTQQ